MPRLTDFLDRFSRPMKIAIQVAILGVILMAVATVGFIEYSAQPSFCTNCHLMQPYYDSWASSSHNTVKCVSCHYAPGIKAEAMGKLQAANQVVKYITGAYGTKPWAEIEDAACLRSGCHTERALEGEVNYEGIRFDHTQHLGELRRGKSLRCTSCRRRPPQGDCRNLLPLSLQRPSRRRAAGRLHGLSSRSTSLPLARRVRGRSPGVRQEPDLVRRLSRIGDERHRRGGPAPVFQLS
jgi:hypothetical protein